MGLWLFLFLVALPIAEIAVFILVGQAIGVLWTLTLVILAAVVGIGLIRMQGLNALARLQESMDRGTDPAGPIAEAALKVVAGLMLIVPGFLTDAAGLVLLLPPVRRALLRRGAATVTVRATGFAQRRRPTATARRTETIEADYEVVGSDPPVPPRPSGWTRPE